MSSRNFQAGQLPERKGVTYSKGRRRYGTCLQMENCFNFEDSRHIISIGDFRSDPAPSLLQPLVVKDEKKRRSYPSSSSRYKDEKTGISTTNKESSPPRKRITSSYRKSDVEVGRRMPVAVGKKRKRLPIEGEGYFGRRGSPQGSDADGVEEDTSDDLKDGDEGYQAPSGMTFMPMSSACDESTDGELEI
jgi:hypothetical protein